MFYFVTGLPGLFAEWCEKVVGGLAATHSPNLEILYADSLEGVTRGLLRSPANDVVVAARHPGGRMRAAFVEAKHKFVVSLDDPRRALADLVLDRNMELFAAIRAISSGCASCFSYAQSPGALGLQAQDAAGDAHATAKTIAQHLGLSVPDEDIAAVVAQAESVGQAGHNVQGWWTMRSAAERELIDGALAGYMDTRATRTQTVRWGTALFSPGGEPHRSLEGPIDVTGRARCLIEGPFIALPQGAWRITMVFDFSPAATDYEYVLEVHAGRSLAANSFVPHPGSVTRDIDFEIDETVDHPVSVRLSLFHSAFDGTMSLLGVTLKPR